MRWLKRSTACTGGLIHQRAPWKTRASIELATLQWLTWYSHHRLMEPLGYNLPAEDEGNNYRQPKMPLTCLHSFKPTCLHDCRCGSFHWFRHSRPHRYAISYHRRLRAALRRRTSKFDSPRQGIERLFHAKDWYCRRGLLRRRNRPPPRHTRLPSTSVRQPGACGR